MFSTEKLSEVVENARRDSSPGGVSCYFVKINDEIGIKVYDYEDTRNDSARNQALMANFGYAPKTGISFDVGDKYCFITQIAIPLIEGISMYGYYDSVSRNKAVHKCEQNNPDIYKNIDSLCNKMLNKGYNMYDVHLANFGMLGDNLVCIDFGG